MRDMNRRALPIRLMISATTVVKTKLIEGSGAEA